jgi:hypothetical protein
VYGFEYCQAEGGCSAEGCCAGSDSARNRHSGEYGQHAAGQSDDGTELDNDDKGE